MKETKTVQVYPDDDIINATISEYGSFGWEVISNQRCQEFDRTVHGVDGSTSQQYSTFNKITFTREKTSPWYNEVSQIEREYNVLKNTAKSYINCKPVLKKPKTEGVVARALGLWLYMMLVVPGVIFTIVRCCKKSKYKKQYNKMLAEWNNTYLPKINELNIKTEELRARAEKCISEKV